MDRMQRAGARAWAALSCATLGVWLAVAPVTPAEAAPAAAAKVTNDLRQARAAHPVHAMADWVVRTSDARGRPYAIVDKRGARLYVFDGRHRLVGATSVLIGQTVGDHTVPGVGERAQRGTVGPDERTTPAGRFDSVPGRNIDDEDVVWLDYEAAFAIHRLRPGRGHADRLARLASASSADNRASLGCVVVPVAFYLDVVQPLLGKQRGVVYVLPDTRSIDEVLLADG